MSTLTVRGLYRKAALSDPADAAVAVGQLADDVDAKALLWAAGTTGAMPASALDGKLYHDTTTDRLLYDMGTTWRKLLYQVASGDYKADNPVDATGFKVSGTSLAASHLSNGVTGTGAVALAASPALTGTPTAPTAAPGTNTTQIATTAFVQAAAPGAGSITSTMILNGTIDPVDLNYYPVKGTGSVMRAEGGVVTGIGIQGVTFAAAFAAAPVVNATSDDAAFPAAAASITTTGCNVIHGSGVSKVIQWIALGT